MPTQTRLRYPILFSAALAMLACNLPTTSPLELTPVPVAEATLDLRQPEITPVEVIPTPTDDFIPYPENVNPLTGLPVSDISLLERRPVSIKVTNYPRTSRPQWGLSLADIVYEYYHNNDLPRFHAIFYTYNAPLVGPIRSARLFDHYLISSYKSNFASGSADSRIREFLLEQSYGDRLIFLLSGLCPPRPVCRFEPDTHNFLVADTEAIGDYLSARGVDNSRQNLNGMLFADQPRQGGMAVTRLYVRYSYGAYAYWQYDENSGRYYRYQDTQEDVGGRGEAYALMTDRLTAAPVMADNVIILAIPHFHTVYTPPANGNPAIEIVDMIFEGSGQAYALRDGRAYNLNWVRAADDAMITLRNGDGSLYPFKPGVTWFQVVGNPSSLTTTGDIWRLVFALK
ncbi:MAG: DUF3048 domain-containing protein [Anaerolineae bacterium]|nr:DUF3048 domain-containing protein [Anaerolineae bacterium]